jgi:hypothetical protein
MPNSTETVEENATFNKPRDFDRKRLEVSRNIKQLGANTTWQ